MNDNASIPFSKEAEGDSTFSTGISRRRLVVSGFSTGALALLTSTSAAVSQIRTEHGSRSDGTGSLTLSNEQFELSLAAGSELHCNLRHRPTGTILSDGYYSYSFGVPKITKMECDNNIIVIHSVTSTGIAVEHRLRIDPNHPWLEENISIKNTQSNPCLCDVRSGFVLPVRGDTLQNYIFTAVPFRREPYGHKRQYADYSLSQILTEARRSRLREDPDWPYDDPGVMNEFPELQIKVPPAMGAPSSWKYASEGWALTNGTQGFLITKYAQLIPEFALLDRLPLEHDQVGLRWGGTGPSEDNTVGLVNIPPGATIEFGCTRLTPFIGDLTQGYYAFRAEMEARGHRVPKDFDPPLQWNEIYDNKLYFCGEWKNKTYAPGTWGSQTYLDPKQRQRLYTLESMKTEARKAMEMGCEALYLDPGWDSPQSSKLWDSSRLGSLVDFVSMLRSEYGLKLALHTPLAGWHIAQYDAPIPGSEKRTASGVATRYPCGASSQYLQETARRLRTLADAGACFVMFDGEWDIGECWDATHGHSVPLTHTEDLHANTRLARMVHETNPKVLIEMHGRGFWDPSAAIYFGHGVDKSGVSSFDEVWGFELMLNSMSDLLCGNSLSLYYYNLAYSLPTYLHVDLRSDNTECVVFWWYASTCRHLGIGGTHEDLAVLTAQKRAVATYRRLKHLFSAGAFFGIDEFTHVHSDRGGQAAVLNCFNFEPSPVKRIISFDPAAIGLATDRGYNFSTGEFRREMNKYVGEVEIAPFGHTLIELI
jgi:hypothetical protein